MQWKHFGPNKATWEMVDQMQAMYPSLFDGWENVFGICFGIFTYVYGCKYHHELCYKAPINDMGVMFLWFLCCYVSCWFASQ